MLSMFLVCSIVLSANGHGVPHAYTSANREYNFHNKMQHLTCDTLVLSSLVKFCGQRALNKNIAEAMGISDQDFAKLKKPEYYHLTTNRQSVIKAWGWFVSTPFPDIRGIAHVSEEGLLGVLTAYDSGESENESGEDLSQSTENAETLLKLGNSYAYGIGVEKSLIEAKRYYSQAVRMGSAEAWLRLGESLCTEDQDLNLAQMWECYLLAANGGNALGQLKMGEWLQSDTPIPDLKPNGQLLDVPENSRLFEVLEKEFGDMPLQDQREWRNKKAKYYYEKAAHMGEEIQGNAVAQLKLGDCYAAGIGTEQDPTKALLCYLRAGDAENAVAQLRLAEHYDKEVYRNPEQAKKWCVLSANAANAQAQLILADWYVEGKNGVGKNEKLSFAYNLLSAFGDHALGQLKIGIWLQDESRGLPDLRDFSEVDEVINERIRDIWVREFASLNSQDQRNKKAVEFYKKAAHLGESIPGNVVAQVKLGDCYADGTGVERKDLVQAAICYEAAVKGGYSEAEEKLARVRSEASM